MKKTITCVLFDYGKVISRPQTLEAKQKQAELAGLDLETFQRLWGQYRTSYDQGVIDGATYWSRIMAHGRTSPDPDRITALIEADTESWHPTVDWILIWAGTLRASGIRTGILSNMPPELVADTQQQDWITDFSPRYFSADIKANKPYAQIYDRVIQDLGTGPAETLFIDDRDDNVRGARRAGLSVIHHVSGETTRQQIVEGYDLPSPE